MVTKKKIYVSPYIKAAQIEVESSFAAGSMIDKERTDIVTSGQEVGKEIDAQKDQDFWSNDSWEK